MSARQNYLAACVFAQSGIQSMIATAGATVDASTRSESAKVSNPMRIPTLSLPLISGHFLFQSNESVHPSGDVENRSSSNVWITAGGQKHCLRPGESTDDIGISDGDGLLLDGRGVLFASARIDLGGGQVHAAGAIKVCDLGTLTVHDAPTVDPALIAVVSTPGFICPGDPAGYKSPQWCAQNIGWDINTAQTGRQC